ncbi:MAG: hypothetical protein ACREC4_02755 [Methylocella sp.]
MTLWFVDGTVTSAIAALLGAWIGSRGPERERSIEIWALALAMVSISMFEYEFLMFE